MTDVVQPAAWIWFQDPKAVEADGYIYVGFTHPDGGIWAGQYDATAGRWATFQLMETDNDDHNVAAFGRRADGAIVAAYSPHNGPLYARVLADPDNFRSWGTPVQLDTDCSYPNLVRFESDGLWYLFYRRITTGNFRPERFRTSSDGVEWSEETTLFDTGENWPYHKVWGTGDRIDFFTTFGHPQHTANAMEDNPLYHYYYDGTWRDSAGNDMGAPPFDQTDVTQVINPGVDNAWNWDVAFDGTNPVVVFATFPTVPTDHRYQYGIWNGASWEINQITPAGRNITENENSPYYSGGIALDHADPSIVYLSRQLGVGSWAVERWTTSDGGSSWSSQAVSTTVDKHMRPMVVAESSPRRVVWFAGRYDDFTDYDTLLLASPSLVLGETSSETLRADVRELAPIVAGPHRMVVEARVLSRFQTSLDPDGIDIPALGGDVTYDATAEVFATLNLETSGLNEDLDSWFPRRASDLLAPYGNELFLRRGIDLGPEILWVPLGYFRIGDVEQGGTSDAPIQISGQDRMSGIVDAEAIDPISIDAGRTAGSAAAEIVHAVYPAAVVVFDDDAFDEPIGRNIIIERSRYDALADIVESLGKVMFWDGEGVLRIEDAPDEDVILWEIAAGENGVLVESSRRVSRDDMANAVVAAGEGSTSAQPARAVAIDTGRNSPTRWFPPDDPTALWFGQVPLFYDSPLLTTGAKALAAARSILRRRIGLPYSVDFGTEVNPALRPRQVVRIRQKDGNREKHIVERVAVPLIHSANMTGSTREQTSVSIGSLS